MCKELVRVYRFCLLQRFSGVEFCSRAKIVGLKDGGIIPMIVQVGDERANYDAKLVVWSTVNIQ